MKPKIVFIGNPLGGDDGIGPYLFTKLENNPKFKHVELLELGVVGFDLISYVQDTDTLIIVDAVRSNKDIGKVVILEEKDLTPDLQVVSQHDFGVEQTVAILKSFEPRLKNIHIIGIFVKDISAFNDKLSTEILNKISDIKKEVISKILSLTKAN